MEEDVNVLYDKLTKEFSKGVFVWYNFKLDCEILYIYSEKEDVAVIELLRQKGKVEICSCNEILNENVFINKKFDYIVGVGIVETCDTPEKLLAICRGLLNLSGKLLLGTENRYAIKYICGDRDPYTNHSFDGVENYRRLLDEDRKYIKGRCYCMAELKQMLDEAGWEYEKFYSAMPSLYETQLVYSESYMPEEELAMRYFPLYNNSDGIFLEEQYLYTDLIKNGMFHKVANCYIIECSLDGNFEDTLQATISLDRGYKNALVTSICVHNNKKKVYKRAVYLEGTNKLLDIQKNLNDLKNRGINVVDCCVNGNTLVMPYINKPIAMKELKIVAKKDLNAYIEAMDTMYELILNSSEHTFMLSDKDRNSANGREVGPILSKGYIDMVPLNCFYDNDEKNPKKKFIYYDQEFYWENCPAKAIMYRAITIIYDGMDKEFERIIPKEELFKRYELLECKDLWVRMSARFTDKLRNQQYLKLYYDNKKVNVRTLYTNRERINYCSKEYKKTFIDIFEKSNITNDFKKIILFGSGVFARQFILQFGDDYPIYSMIDNNNNKWGSEIDGIPINSPSIINNISENDRNIIICVKNYTGIVRQLLSMGVKNYHIYNPDNDYPNIKRMKIMDKLAANVSNSSIVNKLHDKKPYNIGYIAGVFDLFHIGHLNMFKRAKEQCNYLIVGVVSDEGVRLNKQVEPFVPFDERIEMVRSCRYVDEAVKLPLDFCGTQDMFKVYHFDVQFSGSDYEHDAYWLAQKEFLEKHGSTMVFFSYTQSTSSTKLKKAIESRIEEK